ncbi:hypothetical protein ACFQY5_18110 [Paeniroseomonas aquatica]|uniref:Uncharacterized protein n=1 Tax=Paeniroseomonas aquatica TaxID=373043 RepID=A0ABT8A2K4_9PROT|nr:hypothetical protein [Paeniroseomonas aquatica]MDN3563967.1 hypothetical protein [Paeniroseomonas aquatica]
MDWDLPRLKVASEALQKGVPRRFTVDEFASELIGSVQGPFPQNFILRAETHSLLFPNTRPSRLLLVLGPCGFGVGLSDLRRLNRSGFAGGSNR